MFEDFFEQYAARYGHAKSGRIWCYEDGCVYRGLLELGRATGASRWREHLKRLIAVQVGEGGTLLGYSPEEFNIDNILSGRVLFALTKEPGDKYDLALSRLAGQLARHPRTVDGNYWHKKVYPHQIWLDGLYMGLPFQIEYGLTRGEPALVEDALRQLLHAVPILRDPATGLFFHGYDASRRESWSDPQTGLSQSLWGRANGWLAMALIDCFSLLPPGHAARAELARHILALAEAVRAARTPNGLWLQVMDQPGLDGNYEESSCSAMFAYFFLKSARLIEGAAALVEDGRAALDALARLHVRRTDGIWRLENVCEVAGLGGFFGKQRDGSPGYYVSEAVVANDPKGVGPLMMAVAERTAFAKPALATAEASFAPLRSSRE